MPPQKPTEEATGGGGVDDDINVDAKFSNRGCCFWMPCRPAVGTIWWQRITTDDNANSASSSSSAVHEEPWWTRGWKKVREGSELVAGPKWKTFIRRFNKNKASSGAGVGKFHYDPLSYSLNFDEGPGVNGHLDDDFYNRGFSSRYASLPASAKSSMDFGKDGPCFT